MLGVGVALGMVLGVLLGRRELGAHPVSDLRLKIYGGRLTHFT